jgi:O-antigen/teichoic acid export membrane protein
MPMIRDTTLVYALSAVKLLAPLAMPAMLAHRLERQDLGRFAIAASIASTVGILIELGFGLSATRAATGRAWGALRRINDAVVSARLAGACIALPLCIAVSATIFRAYDERVLSVASLTWATAACAGFSNLWLFQANNRLAVYALLEAAGVGAALAAH